MRNVPQKLNTVNNVGAGNKAWVKLQNGPKYLELVFVSNYKPEHLEKITIDLSGTHQVGEIIEATGADLVMCEDYVNDKYTFATEAPYIYVLSLGNQEANTDMGQQFSGLVTLQNDNILVNIHIASNANDTGNGGVANAEAYIDAYAEATEPSLALDEIDKNGRPQRVVLPMLKPHTITNNTVGEVDYFTLPDEIGVEYRRMYLSGGDLAKVEIKKDGSTPYEENKEVAEFMQTRAGRTPQAGVFVVDFVRLGWVQSDTFMPQHERELRLRMDVKTAENVRVLIDGFKRLVKPQG
jgi:hypothetical protein